jgi:prepilin-type N-terminal cleavage/methylation domain-containing protein
MKLNKGFTLIELIVVMAVFLFIVGAALGIFISIITSQKKVLAEQKFLNQISYVQEYMSKALRAAKTAKDTGCLLTIGNIYELTHWDGVTAAAHTGIKFINANDDNTCQEFFLEEGVLYEIKDANPQVALTSSSLPIQSLKFVINGTIGQDHSEAKNTDMTQPKVTILFNILMPSDNTNITCIDSCTNEQQACISGKCVPIRTIQTTVSRRTLNIQQ